MYIYTHIQYVYRWLYECGHGHPPLFWAIIMAIIMNDENNDDNNNTNDNNNNSN